MRTGFHVGIPTFRHRHGLMPSFLQPLAPLIWLPPESIVGIADGGAVTTWPDWSGNGNSPTQGTAGKRPLFTLTGGQNNRPFVRGDGTDDVLIKSFTWNQPAHVWIVLKFNRVGGGSDTALDGLTSGSQRWASFDATRCYAAAGSTLLKTVTPTNWHYMEIQYNGASSAISTDGAATSSGNAGTNNAGGITLFNIGGEGLPAQVDIAEVLGFAGIQTAASRASIASYFAAKYAL